MSIAEVVTLNRIPTGASSARVLHLACGTGQHSAGVQRHIAEIARGLDARGASSWVACPSGSWLQRELPGGVTHLPWRGGRTTLAAETAALARLVRSEAIPVIHAHNRAGMRVALEIRRRTGCTVILTAHTMTPYPEIPEADRLVAVSQAVAEQLRGVFPSVRPEVIFCGVDTERFRVYPESRRRVREELGIGPETPLVLSVSRLGKKTSVRRFLEAAAALHQRRPDVRFALAGDGPTLCRLETRFRRARLGLSASCVLLGDRSDVPAILAAADAFVLCSKQEALGLSILEAMACELPVVGTRVGGMVETLEHGVSGWFSEPDPTAVADRLEGILKDPASSRRAGLAARSRVLERFSLVESIRRHELLYLDRLP